MVASGVEQASILVHGNRWAPLDAVDASLRGDLMVLISQQRSDDQLRSLAARAAELPAARLVADSEVVAAPPYRHPRKILGIGLNYADHARDLSEVAPDEPASFLKGDHTIVGPNDEIVLPELSHAVTTEAELGLIIGRESEHVDSVGAQEAVFGVCNVLDQTAEDILRRNPRFLTRAKNFRSFFSFGPEVVTLDEFLGSRSIESIRVATRNSGGDERTATVANMTHGPWDLVAFHSNVMPWYPGDVLSTGTPGAIRLVGGETVECRISGLRPLQNPVRVRAPRAEPPWR